MLFFIRLLRGIFNIESLRSRISYTLFALAVFRLGRCIPIPGINLDALSVLRGSFTDSGFLGFLNAMSGGNIANCSVLQLGIYPYIQASLMMQVLTFAIPFLEILSKEGESGRMIINRYTRYLAFGISVIWAASLVITIERGLGVGLNLVLFPGWWFRAKAMMVLVAGSMFVMWLGEQLSRFGIGQQGSSVLIFANIVAGLPMLVSRLTYGVYSGDMSTFLVAIILGFVLALTACIVFLEKGERRVPVYYAKKITGRFSAGVSNVASYIPFKINPASIMPVIMTSSFSTILIGAFNYFARTFFPTSNLDSLFVGNSLAYNLLTAALIIWFNFAYISIIFNPVELADNLKKGGGFLPGLRPGAQTADFFDKLLMRIGVPGALYMATLAILPGIFCAMFSLPMSLSGLSLLIAVGVALDISSQVESYFLENKYDGFLTTAKYR